MKSLKLVVALMVLSLSQYSLAVDHFGKTVSKLQVSTVDKCVYFTLSGVSEADPVKASKWFTISSDNEVKKEILSMLLSAYVADLKITVKTTGGKSNCGYAEISTLLLE